MYVDDSVALLGHPHGHRVGFTSNEKRTGRGGGVHEGDMKGRAGRGVAGRHIYEGEARKGRGEVVGGVGKYAWARAGSSFFKAGSSRLGSCPGV